MNNMKFVKRGMACILCLVLIMLMVPISEERIFAQKADEKTISGLGTGTIGNPEVPKDGNAPWKGSYVYYGTFDKNYDYNTVSEYPVRYRVLDNDTTVFSVGKTDDDKAHTMLLDCDYVLYAQPMDDNKEPNVRSHKLNEWAISDIAGHVPRDTTGWSHNNIPSLNDEKDGFIAKSFTGMEQAAITFSSKAKKAKGDGDGEPPYDSDWGKYGSVFTPLDNDRIFVLDAVELTRESYGYLNAYELVNPNPKDPENPYLPIKCRIKKKAVENYAYSWWMRSSYINGERTDRYGSVEDEGYFSNMWSNQDWAIGVSPAFNLDRKHILFSSKIENIKGADEYKLTIMNDSMKIKVPEGKEVLLNSDGRTVVVPYTITNDILNKSKATRVSVLILKEKYVSGKTVVNSDSEINYYYMKLDTLYNFRTIGYGFFELPDEFEGKICGKDYFVYIIAEDENKNTRTDYASEPEEIIFKNAENKTINPTMDKAVYPNGSGYSFVTEKNSKGEILYRTLTLSRTYPSENMFIKTYSIDSDGSKTLIRKLIKKTLKGNISIKIKSFKTYRKSATPDIYETVILKPNGKVFVKTVTTNPDGTENINKTTKKLNPALTDISAVAELLEKSDQIF